MGNSSFFCKISQRKAGFGSKIESLDFVLVFYCRLSEFESSCNIFHEFLLLHELRQQVVIGIDGFEFHFFFGLLIIRVLFQNGLKKSHEVRSHPEQTPSFQGRHDVVPLKREFWRHVLDFLFGEVI